MIISKIIWFFGLISFLYLFGYLIKHTLIDTSVKKIAKVLLCISFFLLVCLYQPFFIIVWNLASVLFTCMLFFLVVYSLASFTAQKPKAPDFQTPSLSISVIIVMHNEAMVIKRTVENLLKLNYRKELLEIIIIDDNSTDNSVGVLEDLRSKIRIIRETNSANKGKPRAINTIAKKLSSDLICIFDADSLPEEDFLLKMVPYFKNDQVVLVQGRNIQYNEENSTVAKLSSIDIDATHFAIISGKNSIKGMSIFEGRGAMLRRSTFIELNGFECDLPTEDWDYGFRCQIAGYQVFYNPEIKCWEQSVENVEDFYFQRYRWLSTTVLTFTKNFKNAMLSPYLSFVQKVDFFLPLAVAFWAINLNLLGVLNIINYTMRYTSNSNYYILLFILMQLLYLIPALIKRKRISDLLYVPLMFIYYWFLSLIVSLFMLRYYLMRLKLNLRKANHYQPSLAFENKIILNETNDSQHAI